MTDDLKATSVYSLLGICKKAGKLQSGEFQTLEAIKNGSAFLCIVPLDASDNTKKLFNDKCKFYKVPIYEMGTKEGLGRAIGKAERSSVAVTDEGLSKALIKKIIA